MIYSTKSGLSTDKLAGLKSQLDNYEYESNIVMNYAIRNNQNISSALSNFTLEFIDYAKEKDLWLGILYLYSYKGNIHIVNYLNEPVYITTSGIALNNSLETETVFSEKITVKFRNESYAYYFDDPFESDIKTLFSLEK
jgi:hypothetical protein